MNAAVTKNRVLVALPCFNEAASIGGVLEEIRATGLAVDTLVIDDCSNDATTTKAAAASACVRLPVNLGIGGAVQTAIKYAANHGYDALIQCDGDGQHPPAELKTLVEHYAATRANLIIGSRFRGTVSFRSTFLRRVGIRLISTALRFFYGRNVADPTSGFRLMDRRAIELFAKSYPLDFPEPISIAVGFKQGLTVEEVPVVMRSREHGQSSIAGLKTISYVVRVTAYIALSRFSPKV